MHIPTVLSLAIGTGVTLVDLNLWLSRTAWERLEDLAMERVGGRRLVDLLERAGLVEVSRDPFGDILKLAWRVDASTALRHAVRIMIQHLPAPPGKPLPNMRLKLTGLSLLKESECLCPDGHGRTSTSLAPADLPPAA